MNSAEQMGRPRNVLTRLVGSQEARCTSTAPLLPYLKSVLPFRLVACGREQMSFRSKVGRHNIVYLQKTLRMLRRLEAFHTALSLSRRLM